jgi:hypothetical protein
MELNYIMAQPAIKYYSWQVEVCINNLMDSGINPKNIHVVCHAQNEIPSEWVKLKEGYPVNFSFYKDTRVTKYYISSIRPNILKQHFELHPDLEQSAIFYMDCDIVFTKPINWEQFLNDDKWYGSDCRWYIGHDYIISKGEDILDKMCEIVSIPKHVIHKNELNSIGAQYLMKRVNARFWAEVEIDSERLYKEITEINNIKKRENPAYHELQIWTADMWAVLWGGWKMGKETVCHADLEFSWGTSTLRDWEKLGIYHNAGVVSSGEGLFYKSEYMNKLPYNEPLQIKEGTASKKYWEIIQKVAKKSVLL